MKKKIKRTAAIFAWLFLQGCVTYWLLKHTSIDVLGVLFLTLCAAPVTLLLVGSIAGDAFEDEKKTDDLKVRYILLRKERDEKRA